MTAFLELDSQTVLINAIKMLHSAFTSKIKVEVFRACQKGT